METKELAPDQDRNPFTPRAGSPWKRLALVALATAGLFLGALPAVRARGDSPKSAPPKLSVDTRPIVREGNLPRSFAPVVGKVSDAVVQVFTSAKARPRPGMDPSDPFFFFFGQPNPGQRGGMTPRQQGVGSGVVVSKDGYLLTNHHVVDGADTVTVKLADGRELPAKVVGRDDKTDVAVLKVDAGDLSAVTFADSDLIEVGDVVFAVGNPFGIGQTVTMGIVSATGRATLGLPYEDFIQTDAAINPGNSGGALVDADGRLIGINSAIISRSGGNQGIGFAIPANMARDVLESIVTDGKVVRGFLGVMPQDVGPALARKLDLKESSGAILTEVTPRSPADKAGLRSGDVVTDVNGKHIRDARHFRLEVARIKPGTSVPLRIRRDGSEKNIKVTLTERPDEEAIAGTTPERDTDDGTLNGVGVSDLNSQNRRQYRIPEKVEGVLVTQVEEDSPSWKAGLRPGDVILELNKERVTAADEAVRLTEKPKDKTTLVKVYSPSNNGVTRFLVVDES